MKLFFKIYSYLLIGIIGLLAVDANISYERAISQFDLNMTHDARRIGTMVAGMVSRVWLTDGQEAAIDLITHVDMPDNMISIRWVWYDELPAGRPTSVAPQQHFTSSYVSGNQSAAFVQADTRGLRQRCSYIPVVIPGGRSGGLELTQSLAPLVEYTRQTLIRSLIITGLLALISGVIIYFFIHVKIRGPLDRLTRKAILIGKGHIEPDLEIRGNDELTDLARTMNDMCTRLLIAKEKIHFEHEARVKTLEQLRHTEQLSTIGQLSAGIAHEIGTPLNVIDGRAKMILLDDLSGQETKECAGIIKAQAEKITGIIRQLLDFTRRRKPRKAVEDMEAIVRQVFHLLGPFAAKQRVDLQLEVEPDAVSRVNVDMCQIQQVLINIIMNGLQAMDQPGRILISISAAEVRSIARTDGQKKRFLRLAIADEGKGIAPEHLKQVFEPFFTTKQIGTGTGLGLFIARELIEEHGGWIEIDGSGPTGTCFLLYLPSCWGTPA